MTDSLHDADTSEIVAAYADRAGFERAVKELLAEGFDRTDLSVLASHDSLEVAGKIAGYKPDEIGSVEAGVAGELGFATSIGIAGALLLTAGPVGVAAAGIVAAGAGVVALRPLFDRLTESVHAAGFVQAVEAKQVLLWVRTGDAASVKKAGAVLERTGGGGITRLSLPVRETPLA